MNVLIACEFSGIVREAFRARGHNAWSCDLLPSSISGPHIQDNVLKHLNTYWDLMIAFPPCTYLTCAQNKWHKPEYRERFPNRRAQQTMAAMFFLALVAAPIKRIVIENPIGRMSSLYRKPDQIIQPYQFGHDARKATCLWLDDVPRLKPTQVVPVTIHRTRGGNTMSMWHVKCGQVHRQEERARLRSITFQGIADAMADQWTFNVKS